ncbi:MAG: hypothetical protein PHS53_03070 [Candidatus Pacebacteria bacterium]|nr:hypothetical protein [Candidatus Paceibacterota bacterium]
MKTIIIILVLVGAVFLGYWYYASPVKNPDSALLTQTTSSGVDDQGLVIGQKTITLLQELEKVNIDRSIFATAAFQSLQDFGVEIQAEPIGRPDPFAPVGYEDGSVSSLGTIPGSTGR